MSNQVFKNLRVYRSFNTPQLLTALFVNRLASSKTLVNNSLPLYNLSTRIIGTKFTNKIVQQTFSKVFTSGQSEEDVIKSMNAFNKLGMSAIIGYCGEGFIYKKGVQSQMDYNADKLLGAAKIATMYPNQVLQVKISSMVDVSALRSVNEGRENVFRFWKQHSEGSNITGRKIYEGFQKIDRSISEEDVNIFLREILESKQSIPNFQCDQTHFSMNVHPYYLFQPQKNQNKLLRILCPLTPEELKCLSNLKQRLVKVIEPFQNNNINFRVVLDAEQSYMQSAINSITEQCQARYNKQKVYIITTVQNYLKNAKSRVQYEVQIARRRNLFLAVKNVRGAYLTQQRKLSSEKKYQCPVCDNFQATTDNYFSAMKKCLTDPRVKMGSEVVAGSHNEETINYVKKLINPQNRSRVTFGQLQGLGDHMSFQLVKQGYPVLKVLPYGAMSIMVPYLIRRAQEISHTTYPLQLQYDLIKDELSRRWQNQK